MTEGAVIYTVGNVTVTRVLEKLIDYFTPEYLFPKWDPAAVREHQEWMAPACWNDTHEHVVLAHTLG
jgi:hypothetical protein